MLTEPRSCEGQSKDTAGPSHAPLPRQGRGHRSQVSARAGRGWRVGPDHRPLVEGAAKAQAASVPVQHQGPQDICTALLTPAPHAQCHLTLGHVQACALLSGATAQ